MNTQNIPHFLSIICWFARILRLSLIEFIVFYQAELCYLGNIYFQRNFSFIEYLREGRTSLIHAMASNCNSVQVRSVQVSWPLIEEIYNPELA